VRKARQRMRKNKDRSPRAADLKVSVIVASNTNTESQKFLKY
jgi:hypothetical protein